MENHLNENAFSPVSYASLRHLAVAEVDGADPGSDDDARRRSSGVHPNCHELARPVTY
jgi:hypothetical protein